MKRVVLFLVVLWSTAVLSSFPKTLQWSSVVIGGGGFIPGLVFNPSVKNLAYLRTDIGGIYRMNADSSWTPITDVFNSSWSNFLGAESVATDRKDPTRLYYAAGLYTESWNTANGSIFASTDQGNTWKTRWAAPFKMGGNDDGRSAGERLAVHPVTNNIIFYGSQANGLWKSTDYGATFTKVSSFPTPTNNNDGRGVVLVQFYYPFDTTGNTIIVGVDDVTTALYKSTDGGNTWAKIAGQPTGFFPHHVDFSSDGKSMYVTYSNGPGPNGISNGAVYKQTVSSGVWTNISPFTPGQNGQPNFGYAGLATDASNPNVVLVSTIDRWYPVDDVYRSTNGGSTWISLSATAKMNVSEYPFLTFGSDTAKFGWWMGMVKIDPFNSNRVFFGTGATLYGTDNAGDADSGKPTYWTPRVKGVEECAVLDLASPPSGPTILYSAVGDNGGFSHTDLSVSPQKGMWTNPTFSNGESVDFAESKPNVVVRVGYGSSTPVKNGAISHDYGVTWTPFATEPPNTMGGGTVAISADASTIVWALYQRSTYYSTNNGTTWTQSQGFSNSLPIVSDRLAASTFYSYDSSSSSLYVSTNYGKTFTKISANMQNVGYSLQVSFGAKGDLWIPSWNGLYHSTDGGSTFTAIKGVTSADNVGFGKAYTGSTPTVYIAGVVQGVYGVWGSVDGGNTWSMLNDAHHQWGWLGQRIIGDPKTFGRVYIATNGRGIVMGS